MISMTVPVQKDMLVPEAITTIIKKNYASGIRFDNTVLSILSSQCGIPVTAAMCDTLRKEMFERSDKLYFLPESITSKETMQNVRQKLLDDLKEYHLCDAKKLYETACAENAISYLRDAYDYADFLEFLLPESIRTVSIFSYCIIRAVGTSKSTVVKQLTGKILATIAENGCITEEDLLLEYPVLSAPFLKKLLEKSTDEVVTTNINGLLCYQMVEDLGFDEGFPEQLDRILEKAEELELPPTIDILHTLLSVEENQNFCNAYGIPDDKTFRRVITVYYHGEKPRKWKTGGFVEVENGDV